MPRTIVPSDRPSIFAAISKPGERQAIVRTTNPPPGISGFLFDVVGDESAELSSDITQHFTEANEQIADNIALRAERLTIRGVVAELTSAPVPIDEVSASPDALPDNPAMEPESTPGAIQAEAQAAAAARAESAALEETDSLFDFYRARAAQEANQTRQSWAFGYFYELWRGRELVTVETPFGIWTDMAIESLRSEQSEDSRSKSDFVLVLQKIRFASGASVNLGQLAGRALAQRSTTANNGNANATNPTPAQRQSFLRMINPNAFGSNPP